MRSPSASGRASDRLTGQESVECAGHSPVSLGQRNDQDDRDEVNDLQCNEDEIEPLEGMRKDEETRQEPDLPGDYADSGRATLSREVADLGQVSDRDGHRPEKTQNLKKLPHQSRKPHVPSTRQTPLRRGHPR